MNRKFYLLSFALALTLALAAFISGTVSRSAASADSNALSALPASDIVITIDTQRLMNETLPTIFADKPGLMAKVNDKIERFKRESGIDARTFDSIAVGLRFSAQSSDDFDAVVIARGHFNSNEVIDAGFAAAKAKHEVQKREEQYEGKTIFVITSQKQATGAQVTTRVESKVASTDTAQETKTATLQAQPAAESSGTDQYEVKGRIYSGAGGARVGKERMAIVALDANTLAVGDLKSVKATIDASMGRGRVDDELVRMATQNASALIGFSGKIPPSVTEKMAAKNHGPEAKYMASIREFYGSFSTIGTDSDTFIAVRTEKPGDAQDISQALNALKLLGGFGMGQQSNGAANPIVEMLKDLSITTQGNEVQIKLRVNPKVFGLFVGGF